MKIAAAFGLVSSFERMLEDARRIEVELDAYDGDRAQA